MALEDSIRAIAERLPNQLPLLETEEATKTALVMPFIAALGYNVFDPSEVVPEFTADVGVKRGEKVDYALVTNGEPIILIECKSAGVNLDEQHATQLFRYFNTTPARIGVLTNGVVYRFHADLEQTNTMDLKPFFEIDLSQLDDSAFPELQRFAKGSFDLNSTLEAATGLKYTREVKQFLAQQLRLPDPGFVRFLAGEIYAGRRTQQALDRFTAITKSAFNEFISDRVYDRLRSAMGQGDRIADNEPTTAPELTEEFGEPIVTTGDELEAFYIVKSILRDMIDPHRITMRDVKSYCGVLIDDNNTKRVCRLYFNTRQKYVGVVDDQRVEERIPIENVDALYYLAERLREAATPYV